MTSVDWSHFLPLVDQAYRDRIPHHQALNVSVVAIGEGMAKMQLPYRADLVGDPETGVLHGGVVTTLLDACCGASVFMKVKTDIPIATLDLRIDYMAPATPPLDLFARAECYRITRNVAFVRATAFHEDETKPIAMSAGTFMIDTRGIASAPSYFHEEDQ